MFVQYGASSGQVNNKNQKKFPLPCLRPTGAVTGMNRRRVDDGDSGGMLIRLLAEFSRPAA
jgi:hypothetical protein